MIPSQKSIHRTRYNKEYFGYIVGFANGDIVLADHAAEKLLHSGVKAKEEISGHLLRKFDVRSGFFLSTPPLVWLELTRKCNLTCPHCYIRGGTPRRGELPTSTFMRIIDELSEMGVWAIAITGGEPMLHPDFIAIVNYAHQRGLLIGIATNGTRVSTYILDQIPRDGVIISVSVDDLHLHKAASGVEFKVMTKALRTIKQLGFEANVMTNTNKRNIASIQQIMYWAQENQVSVRSVPFSPLGRGKKHRAELENSVDDVDVAARFWLDECAWEHQYHNRVGLCVGSIFNYGLSLAYMTRRCSSGRYLCYICSDGTVYPCTMCAGEKIFAAGNLQEMNFQTLWRTDWRIRQYSWENFSQTCDGCILNKPEYYCSSRCPAMSHARTGEFFKCGASDFEIASTIVRTALFNSTPLAKETGVPLVPLSGQSPQGPDD